MLRQISFLALTLFTIIIISLFYRDARKKRPKHNFPSVSFIVPCYNDGDTIAATIQSIVNSYDMSQSELIIINDCSTDDSADRIRTLLDDYNCRYIDLPVNGGKAAALNHAVVDAHYDMLCFVDADVWLNKKSCDDMLNRFASDSRIGAVSCPYLPYNH